VEPDPDDDVVGLGPRVGSVLDPFPEWNANDESGQLGDFHEEKSTRGCRRFPLPKALRLGGELKKTRAKRRIPIRKGIDRLANRNPPLSSGRHGSPMERKPSSTPAILPNTPTDSAPRTKPMPAQLLALTDGPSIVLDKPILLLGRHGECDVQLNSRKVSRRHCCIAQVHDYLVVRDLGSTNGV